ncbi:MAG: hypothetical protein HC842_00260 [Cytophagales bacterium]|nr:hypothetical protein [Cytophagales bacterium]
MRQLHGKQVLRASLPATALDATNREKRYSLDNKVLQLNSDSAQPATGDKYTSSGSGPAYQSAYYDSTNDRLFIAGGASMQSLWFYDMRNGVGRMLSNASTGVGGAHEVIGDPIRSGATITDIWVDEDTEVVYCTFWTGSGMSLWKYNIPTNTGTGFTGNQAHSPGDAMPGFNSHSIKPIPATTKVVIAFYGGGVWIWDTEQVDAAIALTVTSTGVGGAHEVAGGEPMPSNNAIGASVVVDDQWGSNPRIFVGFDDDAVWEYNLTTQEGKLWSEANLGPGGIYEVVGDTMGQGEVVNVQRYKDWLVFGTWSAGVWLYNQQKNEGKRLNAFNTGPAGPHRVAGEPFDNSTSSRIMVLDEVNGRVFAGEGDLWVYEIDTNQAFYLKDPSGGSIGLAAMNRYYDAETDSFVVRADTDVLFYRGQITSPKIAYLPGLKNTNFEQNDLVPRSYVDDRVPGNPSASHLGLEVFPAITTSEADTEITLDKKPVGFVMVFVNGQLRSLGDGVKTEDFYFSADGGVSAKTLSSLSQGDALFVGDIAGLGGTLATTDRIDLFYL